MGYIDRNLLPDEHILFRTKKSRMLFFFPAILTILCFFASYYMQDNLILSKLVWGPWLLAFIFWFYAWIQYATSEFVVTNRRLMMREGFFVRHANEMRLATISQVNVEQSLFGQIFNYGCITINAFGAFDSFTMLAKPTLFQRTVNTQLDNLVSGK